LALGRPESTRRIEKGEKSTQSNRPLTSVTTPSNPSVSTEPRWDCSPGDYERLSDAVRGVLDQRPVDDVIAHVQALVPGASVEDIATEFVEIIKIGLPTAEANDLDCLLPVMFEEERMEVWRLVGLIGGAIR
jgi:hypothetical protein